jgi:hypothetical protein
MRRWSGDGSPTRGAWPKRGCLHVLGFSCVFGLLAKGLGLSGVFGLLAKGLGLSGVFGPRAKGLGLSGVFGPLAKGLGLSGVFGPLAKGLGLSGVFGPLAKSLGGPVEIDGRDVLHVPFVQALGVHNDGGEVAKGLLHSACE